MADEDSVERRLLALEAAITAIHQQLTPPPPDPWDWLRPVIGCMKDQPGFQEMVAYGREHCMHDHPPDDEVVLDRDIRFAVCVDRRGIDDLTAGRLYRVLPDEAERAENMLRVIDDAGQNYLYLADRFVLLAVTGAERDKLMVASSRPGI